MRTALNTVFIRELPDVLPVWVRPRDAARPQAWAAHHCASPAAAGRHDDGTPRTGPRSTIEDVEAWREGLYKTGRFVNASAEAKRRGLAGFIITGPPALSPENSSPTRDEGEK